jgi:predicted lipid-binding transport protein (Tim44 family)
LFDIYTIIFLALAVFIFLRLRSVLGQRTGRERPPYDPYSARDAVRSPVTDKVVTLPPRTGAPTAPAAPTSPVEPAPARLVEAAPQPTDRWKDIAEAGPATVGLDAILAADPTFDAKHFITGARAAYEMIVTAFAEGDRRQLRNLLSREVFEGFDAAITEREGRGETSETRFVSIDGSAVTAAELRGKTAQLTIRFVSKLITATRDRSGAVTEGNAEKVTDVTDVWTFARDLSSRDPNWKVVATEAGQ